MSNSDLPILRPGLSLGDVAAERDTFLADCFVDTSAWTLTRDKTTPSIVLAGRTGDGKSAIVLELKRRLDGNVRVVDVADLQMTYVTNSGVLRFLQEVDVRLNTYFEYLWTHVLCLEFVKTRYRADSISDPNRFIDKIASVFNVFRADQAKVRAIDYLRSYQGRLYQDFDVNMREIVDETLAKLDVEFKGELKKFAARSNYAKQVAHKDKQTIASRYRDIIDREQLRELSQVVSILIDNCSTDQERFYIVIDKLDEDWADTDDVRIQFIQSLIAAVSRLSPIRELKVIIALRADIVERISRGSKYPGFQPEKFRSLQRPIRWTKGELRTFADLRVSNLYKRQYSGRSVSYNDVFPERIGQVGTFDYMVERTLYRPRDLLDFMNRCFAEAEHTSKISVDNVRQVEVRYSRGRREALEFEWADTYPSLGKLFDFLNENDRKSFAVQDLPVRTVREAVALEIGSMDEASPLLKASAERLIEDETSKSFLAFVAQCLSVLYKVGAVGVKTDANLPTRFVSPIDPVLEPGSVRMDTRVNVHPILHGAFNLR